MSDLHIPVLRHGEDYRSLDTAPVPCARTGEPLATMSLANPGLIRRDTRRLAAARAALDRLTTSELIARLAKAAELFMDATLPVGDTPVTAAQHVTLTSSSTGLPEQLVRANMQKNAFVLAKMDQVLGGLTRGLASDLLDRGHGIHEGVPVALVPEADALAAVLPGNSPGVHSLWLPSLALKVPVVLRPSSSEPWTALRLIEAMVAAGVPREAFGFYPSTHAGSGAIIEAHDRVLLFGGPDTVRRYGADPAVEVHGPGYSKVVLCPDQADAWEQHLDVIETSVAKNGGRSCINASTVVVTKHGRAIAEALAERLATRRPLPLDDPDAELAAIASPRVAEAIDGQLTQRLTKPGAVDVSLDVRGTPRLHHLDGLAFLQPTVVLAEPEHVLARTEYGFPYVSVVEVPEDELVSFLGPTLVVTALTEDPMWRRRLMRARHIDRLHLGGVPTTSIRWDQPHEGNLFEWLFRRRAVAGGVFTDDQAA